MPLPVFQTIDEIQYSLLEQLSVAQESNPRGMRTRELIATGFILENPRARVLHCPIRKWSLPLAIGEFAWHISGSDDVNSIAFYAPVWRKFSDDGLHIRGSCYGKRMFAVQDNSESQWDMIVKLLKSDPDSRRAVLSVQLDYREALDPNSPDVPCVSTCQVLIRNGKLDFIVNMRSNDVIWGLPYDVFLFTMLQERLALELSADLGRYVHIANSMHIYERHFKLGENVLSSGIAEGSPMQSMDNLEQIPAFINAEKSVRCGNNVDHVLSLYWLDLLEPIKQFAYSRAA